VEQDDQTQPLDERARSRIERIAVRHGQRRRHRGDSTIRSSAEVRQNLSPSTSPAAARYSALSRAKSSCRSRRMGVRIGADCLSIRTGPAPRQRRRATLLEASGPLGFLRSLSIRAPDLRALPGSQLPRHLCIPRESDGGSPGHRRGLPDRADAPLRAEPIPRCPPLRGKVRAAGMRIHRGLSR
jgi:hypothetical protein